MKQGFFRRDLTVLLAPLAADGGSVGQVEEAPVHLILKLLLNPPKLLSLPGTTAGPLSPLYPRGTAPQTSIFTVTQPQITQLCHFVC